MPESLEIMLLSLGTSIIFNTGQSDFDKSTPTGAALTTGKFQTHCWGLSTLLITFTGCLLLVHITSLVYNFTLKIHRFLIFIDICFSHCCTSFWCTNLCNLKSWSSQVNFEHFSSDFFVLVSSWANWHFLQFLALTIFFQQQLS